MALTLAQLDDGSYNLTADACQNVGRIWWSRILGCWRVTVNDRTLGEYKTTRGAYYAACSEWEESQVN